MKKHLVILSGKFTTGFSLLEWGDIPIAFRPLGVTTLFEEITSRTQAAFYSKTIVLPDEYPLSDCDKHLLDKAGLTARRAAHDDQAGSAISKYLAEFEPDSSGAQSLVVCYGDVLPNYVDLDNLPADFGATHLPDRNHLWTVVAPRTDGVLDIHKDRRLLPDQQAFSGFFQFSDMQLLKNALRMAGNDWARALQAYSEQRHIALIQIPELIDLSHISAYNAGRRVAMAPRAFNELSYDTYFITKKSADKMKMKSEYAWFNALPRRLQLFVPVTTALAEAEDHASYDIAYKPFPTIANLLLFSALVDIAWDRIFAACNAALIEMKQTYDQGAVSNPPSPDTVFQSLIFAKTRSRAAQTCRQMGIDGDAPVFFGGQQMLPVNAMLELIEQRIPSTKPQYMTIMHGDFCGSNLLYDANAGMIQMIDPRGGFIPGQDTICGDMRYDIAKLAHSVLGHYDAIISGHYQNIFMATPDRIDLGLNILTNPGMRSLKAGFAARNFAGLTVKDHGIYEIMLGLFLSMIPLHADRPDRQRAFLANMYRLAKEAGIGIVDLDTSVFGRPHDSAIDMQRYGTNG